MVNFSLEKIRYNISTGLKACKIDNAISLKTRFGLG